MRNLNGLLLRIKGQFNDAFLYGKNLFLVDDESILIIDFDQLIDSIAPSDPDKRVLMRYAFLHNDFFYKADSDFVDFFNMAPIRSFLRTAFEEMRIINVPYSVIEECTEGAPKHLNPGCIHLEIYKSNIFLSGEKGTHSFKLIQNDLKRHKEILDYPATHISAVVGDSLYFSCAHKGLSIIDFRNLKDPSRSIDPVAINTENIPAISTENAYCDFIVRDIDNHYLYEANTNWNSDTEFGDISPADRVTAYKPIAQQNIVSSANFLSSSGHRLVTFSNGNISLHKMEYDERRRDLETNQLHYKNVNEWLNILGKNYGNIYSGYQTVFGLILDTDEGTVALDDDLENETSLKKRIISHGENVKVRHFYRAINYSHIVISIKNNSVEIYSDLTDYFFPKDKKNMRCKIPRSTARTFNPGF